jgi:CSLREA domain-containing protein
LAFGVLLWGLTWSGVALAHGTFVVNTTEDHDDGACDPAPEGDCTLREAILAANALVNDHPDAPDTIAFDFGQGAIPPFPIVLDAPLPDITEGAIIDGASEPRYILRSEKAPVVVLEGAGVDSLLRVRSDSTLIVSLGFDEAAVSAIDAENADYLLVRGCYFGVDVETGDATAVGLQPSFGAHAIHIRDTFRARIGGLDELSRNVVGGAGAQAILIDRTDQLLFHGNFVGLDPTGKEPRPNGLTDASALSVDIRSSEGIEIFANVISSNDGPGLSLIDTPQAAVEDNFIGVDADGRNALGNGGAGLLITGNVDGLLMTGNVISSNAGDGVRCEGPATGQWAVLGNTIGVDVGQSQVLSNSGHGLTIASGCEGAAIGTIGFGQGNVIAHNQQAGIRLADGRGSARGNSLFSNGDLGIDAGPSGVTPNDAEDLQMPINFPTVRELVQLEDGLQISGCTFERGVIDVYEASPDPSGFGEGRRYLGSITEGGTLDEDPSTGCSPENDSAFAFTLQTDATEVTLTATVRDDTSEFSPVYPEPDPGPEPSCTDGGSCEGATPICNEVLGRCEACIDDAEDGAIDTGCSLDEPRCTEEQADVWSCKSDPSSPAPGPAEPEAAGRSRGCSLNANPGENGTGDSVLFVFMAAFLAWRRKKSSRMHTNT